jgi:hypothetical protein
MTGFSNSGWTGGWAAAQLAVNPVGSCRGRYLTDRQPGIPHGTGTCPRNRGAARM